MVQHSKTARRRSSGSRPSSLYLRYSPRSVRMQRRSLWPRGSTARSAVSLLNGQIVTISRETAIDLFVPNAMTSVERNQHRAWIHEFPRILSCRGCGAWEPPRENGTTVCRRPMCYNLNKPMLIIFQKYHEEEDKYFQSISICSVCKDVIPDCRCEYRREERLKRLAKIWQSVATARNQRLVSCTCSYATQRNVRRKQRVRTEHRRITRRQHSEGNVLYSREKDNVLHMEEAYD